MLDVQHKAYLSCNVRICQTRKVRLLNTGKVLAATLLMYKLAAYVEHLHNDIDSVRDHRNKAEELDITHNLTRSHLS